MKKAEKTRLKIFYQKKFFLLFILTVFASLAIFRFGRSEQKQKLPLQVVNEALLTGDCSGVTDCVLTLVYPNGATRMLENVFSIKKDTPVYLFPNGKTFVYILENDGAVIMDIIDKTRLLIPNTRQAKFLQKYKDSFWIDNGNHIELYDLGGNQKIVIKKNLLPNYTEGKEYYIPALSPLYPNNEILAQSGTRGEGFSTVTLWEIFPEKKATKLVSNNTLRNACAEEECVWNSIDFLNTQAGFLVITEHIENPSSTRRTEVYKLFPDGNKESYELHELVSSSLSASDGVILNNDDNSLYYAHNGVYKMEGRVSVTRNLIYKYNFDHGELEQILDFKVTSDRSNYFKPLTLSLNGNYMLLNDSRPDSKGIYHNFNTILSINERELKSNLDPLLEGKKIIGWVNTEDWE